MEAINCYMFERTSKEIPEMSMQDGSKTMRVQGILCGKREDILELLEELGEVPEEVRERIEKETNPEFLKHWHKLAARVNSVEIFKKEMLFLIYADSGNFQVILDRGIL